jgi:hypothetical protein
MEHPIACTLSPAGYRQRTDELTKLAARALLSRQQNGGGQRLVFTDTAENERDLRAAIAAEADCCAFLELKLTRTLDGLVLDITGPPDAQHVMTELFRDARRRGGCP